MIQALCGICILVFLLGVEQSNGSVLRIPLTSIPSLDATKGNELNRNKILNQIAANLVQLDESFQVMPELAENWQIDRSAKTIVFRLDSNRKFHDGAALSAKKVMEILSQRQKDGSDVLSQVEDMAAIGPNKLRFTLKIANFSYFLRKLSGVESSIFEESNGVVNGTGPFKVAEWRNTKVIVRRVPNDSRGNPDSLSQIEFLETHPREVVQKFNKGEIDSISSMSYKVQEDELKFKDNFEQKIAVAFSLVFNLNAKVFSKHANRRAVSLAIDRDKFLDGLAIHARSSTSMIPHGFLGFGNYSYPVDMAEARQLVRSSSKNSRPVVRIGLTYKYKGTEAIDSYLLPRLREIGFEPRVKFSAFKDILKGLREGRIDLAIKGEVPQHLESHTAFIPYLTNHSNNVSNYSNKRLDQLYLDYESGLNREQKLNVLKEMDSIVRQDLPALPMFNPIYTTWYSNRVKRNNNKKVTIKMWRFPYHRFSVAD